MSDSEYSTPSSQENGEAPVPEAEQEQVAPAPIQAENELAFMNVPLGVVPGNFLATVFLTMHISLSGIVHYLRTIPIPFFRAFMYWSISLDIINELSDGGLEEHPTLSGFIGYSPQALRQHIENLVAALDEIEEGHPRHMMYGAVMRIIAELVFDV